MGSLEGLLVSVRTAKQGEAMEKGKFTREYEAETATLALCSADFARLGLEAGEKVRVSSAAGEKWVTCRVAEGPQGLFFLPLGPTANALIGVNTHGTGVPDFKNTPVILTTREQEKIREDRRR